MGKRAWNLQVVNRGGGHDFPATCAMVYVADYDTLFHRHYYMTVRFMRRLRCE